MTNKPLIVALASVGTMAGVLWSMPAAADGADVNVHSAHDKWPAVRQQATGVPEPGTLALLALGLVGIGLATAGVPGAGKEAPR